MKQLVGEPPSSSLSAEERLDRLERRFREVEDDVQSFLPEEGRFERLRREGSTGASSPVAGMLIGIKDVFRVAGLPTRAGTPLPAERFDGPEAVSVRRLREAGALIVGKTVSTEMAFFAPGPTRNPWDVERTPGGSSSGSAAAVAAGLCDAALGTQTIGSVCRPASFCGVLGYKPTRERISRDGLIPLAPSLDHVGVFARSAAVVEAVARALVEDWQQDAAPARPRIGLPVGPYLERAEVSMRKLLEDAADDWRARGGEVREVLLFEDFDEVEARHRRILAAEFHRAHRELLKEARDHLDARTVELGDEGSRISDGQLEGDLNAAAALAREVEARMDREGVDVWWAPAAPGPAPRGLGATGDPVMNLPWTQIGFPVLGTPRGMTEDGLPLGLQWIARPGQDEVLLAVLREIEREMEGEA